MLYSWQLVVWMFTVHVSSRNKLLLVDHMIFEIVQHFKITVYKCKVEVVMRIRETVWTHPVYWYWSRILHLKAWLCLKVFNVSVGLMTCSLFNSVAAFQHEKEPNELNVSLDDLHSKRHSHWKAFMLSSTVYNVHIFKEADGFQGTFFYYHNYRFETF